MGELEIKHGNAREEPFGNGSIEDELGIGDGDVGGKLKIKNCQFGGESDNKMANLGMSEELEILK